MKSKVARTTSVLFLIIENVKVLNSTWVNEYRSLLEVGEFSHLLVEEVLKFLSRETLSVLLLCSSV